MISFFVRGQSLKISQPLVVSDTIDYLEAAFVFQTSDWAGCSKWAHFFQGEKVYDIMLTDDKIRREDHLNLSAGEWTVYLHGASADGMRITTEEQKIMVQKTGVLEGQPLPELPLSVEEQFDNRITALEKGGIGPGTEGTTDHSKLTKESRSLPGQHPIGAITGLQDALDNKQPKGNYATKDEIPAVPNVPAWAMQPNKPTYTADEVGALAETELQTGVDNALDQAKASGAFDGKDGGYYIVTVSQPDPNTATFAFAPSKAGMPPVSPKTIALPAGPSGKPGGYYRPSVQQSSPESIKFVFWGSESDLPPVSSQDLHLPAGKPGDPGKTPVRGMDYWTPEDQEQIVQDTLAALPEWKWGAF